MALIAVSVLLGGDGRFEVQRGSINPLAAATGTLRNGTDAGWSVLNVTVGRAALRRAACGGDGDRLGASRGQANLERAGGNTAAAYTAVGIAEAALSCWHIAAFVKNNDDRYAGQSVAQYDCALSITATTLAHAWPHPQKSQDCQLCK